MMVGAGQMPHSEKNEEEREKQMTRRIAGIW